MNNKVCMQLDATVRGSKTEIKGQMSFMDNPIN